MYQQMIFVNLAVNDVDASKKFFTELGYTINPQFSDRRLRLRRDQRHDHRDAAEQAALRGLHEEGDRGLDEDQRGADLSERREPREGRRAGRQGGRGGRHRQRQTPGLRLSCTAAPSTTSTATPGRSCGWTRRRSRAEHPVGDACLAWARCRRARPMRPTTTNREIETLEEFDATVSARGTLAGYRVQGVDLTDRTRELLATRHRGRRLPRLPDARGRGGEGPRRRRPGLPARPGPALRPVPRPSLHARRAVRLPRQGVRARRRTPSRTPGSSGPRPTATSSPRCCAPSTTTPSPTPSTNSCAAHGWWA